MTPRERFPRTYAAFSELPDGEAALEHVLQLEQGFADARALHIGSDGPARGHAAPQYDVALCGGGLSLVYGAYLARQGVKVVIFDRRRIGCGHREWNVSRAEMDTLADAGLFTQLEVEALVRMRYQTGICRWHGGGTYPVSGVLDCVVDAEGLLTALRARAEAAGATLLDHHQLLGYRTGPGGVAVTLRDLRRGAAQGEPAPSLELTTRLLLDGMGAQSPHARFDLCCPTVGGVLGGLPLGDDPLDLDPQVGEILVTTEGVEDGRQHIWEGFPAPPARGDAPGTGQMTVYLFYYAEPAELPEHPLLSLYERFFATRPRYKRGEARLLRPTYGFIPAYSRLRPMPVSPRDRVLLVGDAASRHSPLTFCGFGSMLRSFLPVSQGVLRCLAEDRLSRRALTAVWGEPPALRVMGGLTLMMMPARGRFQRRAKAASEGQAINRLLDAAFAALSEEGQDTYAAFIQDRIEFAPFFRFMHGAARRYPEVYRDVFQKLSVGEVALWLAQLVRLSLSRGARQLPEGAAHETKRLSAGASLLR